MMILQSVLWTAS